MPYETANPLPNIGSSPSPSSIPQLSRIANLSDLKPVETRGYIGEPTNGPERIGTTTYEYSVRFTCGYGPGDVIYDVAGFNFLNATIGIPNDTKSPPGNTMIMTFLKDSSTVQQLGSPLEVAIGQPRSIHLDLQSATQLDLHCVPDNKIDHQKYAMDFVLGNATLGLS